MNLYVYAANDTLGRYDYLGLKIIKATPLKRACTFMIYAGHGAVPDETDSDIEVVDPKFANSEVEKMAESWLLPPGHCGDRVGVVSCFSGDILKAIMKDKGPDWVIMDKMDQYDNPDIPNYIPNPDLKDPVKKIPNPQEPGFLLESEALSVLESKIKAAETQAEEDCKYEEKTCCSSISISVMALTRSGGKRLNFEEFSDKTQFGRALKNYKNVYNCKSKVWANKKWEERKKP